MTPGRRLRWSVIAPLLALPAAAAEPDVRPVLQLGHATPPVAATWLPDPQFLASVTDEDLIIWDTATGHVLSRAMVPRQSGTQLTAVGLTARTEGVDLAATVKAPDPESATPKSVCQTWRFDPAGLADPRLLGEVPGACPATPPVTRARTGRSWRFDRGDIDILPGPDGGPSVRLVNRPRETFTLGAVSPDARAVAQMAVLDLGTTKATRVVARSLRQGEAYPDRQFPGAYGRLQWLDDRRYLLTPWPVRIAAPCLAGPLPDTLIVDAETGDIDRIASVPQLMLLGTAGAMIGIGPTECPPVGQPRPPTRLLIRQPGRDWQPLPLAATRRRDIYRLAASPDGTTIALMTTDPGSAAADDWRGWQAWLVPLDSQGRPTGERLLPISFKAGRDASGEPIDALEDGYLWGFAFGRDSGVLVIGIDEQVYAFDSRSGARIGQPITRRDGGDPGFYSADRNSFVAGTRAATAFRLYDLRSGGEPIEIADRDLGAVGVLPGRNLLWSVDGEGTTRFYDQTRRRRILTVYRLPAGGFLTIDDEGRYDSNQGAESATIRWQTRDQPFDSLPPQMFMRDRYEPDLLQRRLNCTMARNCEEVFAPPPPVTTLDRKLPVVRVADVEPGPEPGTARVTVEASAGRDGAGLSDLRLLRDGRLVHSWPETVPLAPGAVLRRTIVVPVPARAGAITFTAYAFNGDRRKGETSDPVRFTPPPHDRPRRAFVLNIGIDRYAVPGLDLDFAAADAKALAERLQRIDGFPSVRQLLLTSEAGTDAGGQRRPDRARKALLRAAFGLLSGEPGDWAATLAAAGIDTSGFGPATPDDLVIISWSGHGTVGKAYTGEDVQRFALLPSDITQPSPLSDIDEASMVTADELADWLRPLDAGETVVIIDACHSGASVAANGFKPGPMGDRTLGQLAFDKGIRILAATQADNVAGEEAGRGLGLLTAALIDVGLGGRGPEAEGGWIRLDAVLRLAAASLPERLRAEQQRREAAAPPPLLLPDQWVPSPPVQVPAVFDFTGQASPAWVATQAPPAP